MQWFMNLQTKQKLLSSFGSIAILIGVVGYMGVQGVGSVTIESV